MKAMNKRSKVIKKYWNKFKKNIKVPEKYIISYKNNYKERWDIFVLLLALQNSFIIPLDLAFEPKFTSYKGFANFDLFVDIIFVIDMIIMFFTSY